MKLVHIINGIYGYHISEAVVEPKTVKDAPFFVSDEEGERLIGLGVAELVTEAETAEVAPVQPTAETSEETACKEDAPQTKPETLGYSRNMKLDDLKKVAIDAGASKTKVKKMRSKDEVISAIEAAVEKANAKNEDSVPQIGAADFV